MKVSVYITVASIIVTLVVPNIITGGLFCLVYLQPRIILVRHLIYLKKRNKFYEKNDLSRKE